MPNKKKQNFKALVIVVLLVAALGGAGGYQFLYKSGGSSSLSSPSNNNETLNAKNRIETLNQQLKLNPNDVKLHQDLGDTYYDLGALIKKTAPNESNEDYRLAVENYQVVLNTKQDLNIMTDMATAAYYSEQFDLAEKSFLKVLSINPDFAPALNNYGIFLYDVKKDNISAIRMWQTVLNQDPNGPNSDQLKKLINQAQSR